MTLDNLISPMLQEAAFAKSAHMPVSCRNIEVTDIPSKLVRELLIFFAHFKALKDSSRLSRPGISDISRSVRCARLIFIVLFALKFCLKEIRSFNYEAARGIHRRAGRNAGGKRRDYNKLCSRSSTSDCEGGNGSGRYLHASFEDLLSSEALCGIRELNRNIPSSAKTG